MKQKTNLTLTTILVLSLFINGCSSSDDNPLEQNTTSSPDTNTAISTETTIITNDSTSSFSVISNAVKSNNILPFTYTCDGLNSTGDRGGKSPTLTFLNIPDSTKSFAITMHTTKGVAPGPVTTESIWVLFDIPITSTTIEEGEINLATVGILGVSEQGANEYFPPCSNQPIDNNYTITAYALPSNLNLPATTTYSELTSAANNIQLATDTLILTNVRYNPSDTDDDDNHVPVSVPVTCSEKSSAFTQYSDDVSIACDTTNNTMTLTSNTGIPQRSLLDNDKLNVGIKSWIGRVPLKMESQWKIPMQPTYLSTTTNNMSIHYPIGIAVDGVPILHYAKEISNTEIANLSTDYSSRDTVLLGEIDQCGAHAGNGEDYHYHYAPLCLMDTQNPSKPLGYMFDGIPLYFGEAGGVLSGGVSTNYGGGRYSNLNFLPSDVKDGTNPLDNCNGYDLNNDGDTSGYVYYTTKDAPYTAGCFRGVANSPEASITAPLHWGDERDISLSGSEVDLTDDGTMIFEDTSWRFTEITPQSSNAKLSTTAILLYRQLKNGEIGYVSNQDCWRFRYREDKTDTTGANDTINNNCRF